MHLNHFRTGNGEPLVLIHGIGSQWQMWLPVIDRLADEHDVIAIDLPGFAASPPPPPGTPPGVASLTNLVEQFLRDELGLDRPHVAGNSLGGWIALELAKRARVRSATGLSPAGFHNRWEAIYQRVNLWLTVRTARLMAPRAETFLASRAARTAAFGHLLHRPANLPPALAAEASRALAGAYWFDDTLAAITRERFIGGEQIRVPVTIAWAEHDRVLLPRQARRAVGEIPGARLLTLRGCGHVATFDDPDQVSQVLLESSRATAGSVVSTVAHG